MPDLSVIVPVFDHWHLVPELLVSLGRQSLVGKFELLLVDNGAVAFSGGLALPAWARVLHCPTPGSYAARNAALAVARGELLAFTDADCRPEARWLELGIACWTAAADRRRMVAGGIRVEPLDRQAMTVSEIYDVALGLPQARYVRRGYAITANLFVPAALFKQIGPFDPSRFSGGDAEFCRRAGEAGVELVYCDSARVVHPARRHWRELATKKRRVKGGQLLAGSLRRRAFYALRTVLPPFDIWLRILLAPGLSPGQRLRACGLQAGLWMIELGELGRLSCGRPPVRN